MTAGNTVCAGLKGFVALFALALTLLAGAVPTSGDARHETRYLAFQMFTGAATEDGGRGWATMREMLSPAPEASAFVKDLVSRIGTVGRGRTRLAVFFGPLAFDNSDAEIRRLIDSAFSIALQQNVAVGFHIDDSMFWARRKDLLNNPENVEWLSWSGTLSTGRRIDWGPKPTRIAPQMCFNSRDVQAAVRNRGALIGRAIQAGRARLRRQGKDALFAGVIAGWETQIGQNFNTKQPTGFHALANLGVKPGSTPTALDAAREKVVQTFIRLWADSLVETGVPRGKIYSHIAFQSKRLFDVGPDASAESYSRHNHFTPPAVAFGDGCRPGFSTYPQPGLFEQIYAEGRWHGNPTWASCEGTNLQLGTRPGQSGLNMETYLAKMFNHGAALVNIYSWGLGGKANRRMDFRVVTENEEALRAYRKFLSGERLTEAATSGPSLLETLPAKIHRIQKELPAWIRRTHGQAKIQPLMRRLDAAVKANNLAEAERLADQVLKLIRT